jgi:threonine/homoserine/homoserine lactone efflux protein
MAGGVTLLYSTGGTVLMFLVIGVLAGALTGVPIGPVNVAVIDAAYRHTLRRAIAVGLGGACGDGLYSGLGVLGVTPVLRTYPSVPPILYAVSGVVLLVYGFLTARSQPVAPATPADSADASQSVVARRELWSGFTVGLALIVLNPAAIVTWVVIMGSMIPEATHLEGLACTFGVLIGSIGWFTLVAYLTHKGKNVLGEKAAWIPRVVGIGLMLYAVYLIAKAVKYVVA